MRPNRLSGAAVMCRKASSRPKVSAATPATPTMALTIEPDTAQLALIFSPEPPARSRMRCMPAVGAAGDQHAANDLHAYGRDAAARLVHAGRPGEDQYDQRQTGHQQY